MKDFFKMNDYKVILKYRLNGSARYFLNKTVVSTELGLEEYARRLKEFYKNGVKYGAYFYYFVKVEDIKMRHYIE